MKGQKERLVFRNIFMLSFLMFVSYIFYIVLYGFLICYTMFLPVDESESTLYILFLCGAALGGVTFLWMKKYGQRAEMAAKDFRLAQIAFCLEYCCAWGLLEKVRIDILAWPVDGIVAMINHAYRNHYASMAADHFLPYNIVELDPWVVHGLSVICYLAFLAVLKWLTPETEGQG